RLDGDQIDDGGTPGAATGFGDLVAFEPVHPAPVGEEEDIRVRRGDDEVFHEVLRLSAEGRDAAPAPPLAAVRSDGQPLDVPVVGQGDDDVLFGDEVLDVEVLFRRRGDLGAAGIVVLLLDLQQLVFDDGVPLLVVLQDGTQ